jgi:hypothetical protein
VTQPAPE